MSQIAIIDYGMGNIESVLNAFKSLGSQCYVVDNPAMLDSVKGIVLPGVGAFHTAMQHLMKIGFIDTLNNLVMQKKIPFLGICLGMQLLAYDSTEHVYSKGLGWIKGNVVKIEDNPLYRVPHVGWNNVTCHRNSLLFNRIPKNAHFYFDHSYYLQCDSDEVLATCDYGGRRVACVQKNRIFGVQFHPEKSQRNGLVLLRNFLNYVG